VGGGVALLSLGKCLPLALTGFHSLYQDWAALSGNWSHNAHNLGCIVLGNCSHVRNCFSKKSVPYRDLSLEGNCVGTVSRRKLCRDCFSKETVQ
jgi:hypothetical protein